MTTWKWIAAAAALIVTPELALAQSPAAPRGGPLARFDADGDGKITLAEVDAVAQAEVAAFDADGDEQLTLKELREGAAAARFKALDADGDGKVTLAEFQAQPAGGRRGVRMLPVRDEDRDGKLSLSELTAMARRLFEVADADANGELTTEELAQARPGDRRFGRRGEGGDGEQGQGGRRGSEGRERPSAEEVFGRLDADRDGSLTADELKGGAPRRRRARPEGEIY